MREDEERVGARLLGDAREAGGLGPAVADAGDDGRLAGRLLDGDRHHVPVLVLADVDAHVF